ncbi:MAG: hypothetical protein H7A21_00435 [Spirochaetales bacterium]|nr:hypothetical protein [Leptospiraceae bacterium]MCP5479877.1 hypothetical protein [Spirochaetales bacterium]MCP5486267.1 hypothetical protein [Spirochaetales bacterium]
MVHIELSAPEHVLQSFERPGQFVELTAAGESAYFAIASAPGAGHLEFLIKDAARQPARALCRLAIGQRVAGGVVAGQGFDLSLLEGDVRAVHLFAMGSGVAPLRSMILHRMHTRAHNIPITLWQSAFSVDHVPFLYEHDVWTAAGVEVVLCLDQDPASAGVVEMLGVRRPDLREAAAYWVGSETYGETIRDALKVHGLPSAALLTNT